MRCQKVRSFLSAYCKNELAERRREAISAHLKVCPECRREEILCREIEGSSGKLTRFSVSNDFNARLLNRLAKERLEGVREAGTKAFHPKNAPLFGWSKIIPAAATVCLVLVFALSGGLNILDRGNSTPTFAGIGEDENALDNRYLTVQPVDNPAHRRQVASTSGKEGGSNQGTLVQHVNSSWAFKKELERANRIKSLMNYMAGRNAFNYQPYQFASILTNPEGQSVVMRLPFGEQIIFDYGQNGNSNNSGR